MSSGDSSVVTDRKPAPQTGSASRRGILSPHRVKLSTVVRTPWSRSLPVRTIAASILPPRFPAAGWPPTVLFLPVRPAGSPPTGQYVPLFFTGWPKTGQNVPLFPSGCPPTARKPPLSPPKTSPSDRFSALPATQPTQSEPFSHKTTQKPQSIASLLTAEHCAIPLSTLN